MKKKVGNYFVIGRNFKKEFKKQMRMIIIITLGFTIAFTWRQTIFDISQSLMRQWFHLQGDVSSSIITSTFITIVSGAIIIFSSHLLKDNVREGY